MQTTHEMQQHRYPFDESAHGAVICEYRHDINYALVHNRHTALLRCEISNDSPDILSDISVKITGEAVKPASHQIDSIAPDTTIDITKDIALVPDPDEMIRLTESRATSFTLSVSAGDSVVFCRDFPLRLMPYDQWLGIGECPEMLAAFVMPNHPMLERITANASRYMAKWTGSSALDEYQSGDANRVRQQVAAIYEALREEGLVYVTPPASFEQTGQRIRTVDKILTSRQGTCLDLTLLMASALEAIGIQPLIVILQGHAFVGAWLAPGFGSMIGDDASLLLKNSSDGISDMVFVETTMLTSSSQAAFDIAVASAIDSLKNGTLECYVDVHECRLNGIRPIAMRVPDGENWVIINEPDPHTSDTESVRRVNRYDLSVFDNDKSKVGKFTIWERKLLDFSLRNNLLNMKLGRKIIPLVSFSIDQLEDELQAGKSYHIHPFPIDAPANVVDGMVDSSRYSQLEQAVTEQIHKGVITSYLKDDELKNALKFVYRSSRTAIEENGANNLYLVLGVLKWLPTEKVTHPLYAPILLLPVEILRGARGSGYTLRTRDEDTSINITLTEMLKQQHDIDLSALNTLPTDESGVDVNKIFAIIRDKIRDKRGWNVIEESMIGLFSFSKFVMWHDIHSNSALLQQNPIVTSLVDGKLNFDPSESATDARQADISLTPDNMPLPIDVDSSQFEAIVDSGEGKSFVLHGPPGTGKSQTITNMIANALYHGKRVLFVAEKMAALEVVQARLQKIGLAPFCLELHSNKVTKQHFLNQIDTALNVVHGNAPANYAEEAKKLYDKRMQLISYVEALHRPAIGDLSLHDCISRYIATDSECIDIDITDFKDLTAYRIGEMCDCIRRLDTIFAAIGNPMQNPYRGLEIINGSAEAEALLNKEIAECGKRVKDIAHRPELVRLCMSDKALGEISAALEKKAEYDNIRDGLAARYGHSILDINLGTLSRQWADANSKWVLARFFSRRSIMKQYALTATDIDTLVDAESRLDKCLSEFRHRETEITRIFGIDTHDAVELLEVCTEINSSLKKISKVARLKVQVGEFPEAIARWQKGGGDTRNWYIWCKEKAALSKMHLDPVIDYIQRTGKSGAEAADVFAKSLYRALAVKIINSDEQLRYFRGALFDEAIAEYRRLTARFQELSKKEIFCRLAANVPVASMAAFEGSEIGILKRNIKNGGRGTSIRKLIDQIPNLMPRLCPCMLMSPLSVAQYIDLGNEPFDLVIFDEASQMPTSEAVGAIARGKALVVVGDPKQMPPTNFFSASSVSDDEADIDDMESILDDCLAISMPSKHLSWHYRSKHESLIAFSNSQYYDGRLLTFPSVDDRIRKVSLRLVDGEYQRSGSRVNLPEAQAVVDEVIRRLSDPKLSKLSIGIVSFSKVQQDKIEDLLNEELQKHPDLESLAYECHEPIFIKNLENVQGDERDVILFSVGYGPDKNGKMSMNFGPLNNSGGERRLNVAVSRARHEMIVFSSMKSDRIDLRRTNSIGVEGLKKFLEYAENGSISMLAENQNISATSRIAARIAEAIESRGYQTRLNVGRSQFKIDIAVIDPDNADRYLLGVMLDGESYYHTKTMRDREIVQPSVLRMLQWKVMRVWTLDWYERPDKVIDAIISKLEESKNAAPPADDSNDSFEIEIPADSYTDQEISTADTDANANVPPASPVKPYETAKGIEPAQKVSSVDELYGHDDTIFSQINAIVACEQPITEGLIYKRIVKLWGLTRVSPKLQVLVDRILADCNLHSTPGVCNGRIWWTDRNAAESFNGFRTDSDRDIQDMPSVEIENAMLYVIDQQIALNRDDFKRLTANVLGFTRKGTNIEAVTEQIVHHLVNKGLIAVEGEKISRPTAQ